MRAIAYAHERIEVETAAFKRLRARVCALATARSRLRVRARVCCVCVLRACLVLCARFVCACAFVCALVLRARVIECVRARSLTRAASRCVALTGASSVPTCARKALGILTSLTPRYSGWLSKTPSSAPHDAC